MSDLASLTNAGRADVIPDCILSKPRLLEIGKSEEEFARRYLDMLARGCANLPPRVQTEVMSKAADDIKVGEFTYGANVWGIWAMAKSCVPFLTLLSLQVRHGDKVTMEDVIGYYDKGDPDKIAAATWELWGLTPTKKKDAAAAVAETDATKPTGEPSTGALPPQPPPASGSSPTDSNT